MIDVCNNPCNVVALSGKRIRQVPIKDLPSIQINDPENHGVPLILASSWDIAKTLAAYEGTWALIYQRADRYLLPLVRVAYTMPCHDHD